MAQAQVYIAVNAKGQGVVTVNGVDLSDVMQAATLDLQVGRVPRLTLTLKRDTQIVIVADRAEIVQED